MFMDSPFPHHGPLEPQQVHGRDELIADLVARVSAHRPTVLVAPRRYGKTSVLGCLESRLGDTVTVVRVDLYELRSWADFAVRLDGALAGVPTARRRGLDRIAASLEVNLGVVKASLARPTRPNPDMTADRLLDVLVAHAQAHPTVVVFDEFSSIIRVDGAAGMLRTKLQHHYQNIGLVFAGSEPSTMRMLFTGTDQPFYAQADLVDVPPLSLSALVDIIDAGFDGAPPAGVAGRIHTFASGHPQRSMQLAAAAWGAVRDGFDTISVWEVALERCRVQTADSHETRFSGLPPADQAVMRLAASDGVLFGRDAELLSLSRSSAQHARQHLVEQGQIAVGGGGVVVVDPLYADWIRRRFTI
ncbi:MAG: ATP-binding protein [Ilumatobacteraceae bacterium]